MITSAFNTTTSLIKTSMGAMGEDDEAKQNYLQLTKKHINGLLHTYKCNEMTKNRKKKVMGNLSDPDFGWYNGPKWSGSDAVKELSELLTTLQINSYKHNDVGTLDCTSVTDLEFTLKDVQYTCTLIDADERHQRTFCLSDDKDEIINIFVLNNENPHYNIRAITKQIEYFKLDHVQIQDMILLLAAICEGDDQLNNVKFKDDMISYLSTVCNDDSQLSELKFKEDNGVAKRTKIST